TQTCAPVAAVSATRRATRLISSGPATEVPPYFCTMTVTARKASSGGRERRRRRRGEHRHRKAHLDREPALVARVRPPRRAVRAGDRIHDREAQPEPVAVAPPLAVESLERLEQPLELRRRDDLPAVLDRQHREAALRRRRDRDPAAGDVVPDRV